MARTIVGEKSYEINGHEVYCSLGLICSEIDVLAINKEDRDGGKVMITFKNRTGNNAIFQVRLEILNAQNEILSHTRPENVAIGATQEKIYEMPGLYKKNGKIRVILSKAY